MEKFDYKKWIIENKSQILSEQSGPLAPMFADHGSHVSLNCPPGYRFQDAISPTGQSSPQVLMGMVSTGTGSPFGSQTGFMDAERLLSSKCVPMQTIPDPDTSDDTEMPTGMGMTKPSKPGKTPTRGLKEVKDIIQKIILKNNKNG